MIPERPKRSTFWLAYTLALIAIVFTIYWRLA